MRAIGYGSQRKAESWKNRWRASLRWGATARSGQPCEEGDPRRMSPFSFFMIPPPIYRATPRAVVSFDTGGELAKLFADPGSKGATRC